MFYFMYILANNPHKSKKIAPVQTGPGAHRASYTMGTGYFPGAKRPSCGVDHPPSSGVDVKEGIDLYIYSSPGPSWPVLA
jgi:hypothetical protein